MDQNLDLRKLMAEDKIDPTVQQSNYYSCLHSQKIKVAFFLAEEKVSKMKNKN